MAEQHNKLVEVENLVTYFPIYSGLLQQKTGDVKAVDDISFFVRRGETLGLVGESGCGKTTTGRSILKLEEPTSGNVIFEGKNLIEMKGEPLRKMRAHMQPIFQDPFASLNPRMNVGNIIGEPLLVHNLAKGKELRERVEDLLNMVGLAPQMAERYPHEFSGGQRQRIAIARALSTRPKLMVLDEPVSALDVSIRAQILNLLKRLQETYNLSFLLIAHNLATVRYMSHRVGVMYLGKIVEEADPSELFTNPMHPYTKALISASLPAHPRQQRDEIVLTGEVPSPLNPPSGCTFHPRCPFVMDHCSVDVPEYLEVSPNHKVACHLYANPGP